MSKILVGINNLSSIYQPVYANHMQLWYRLGRNLPEHEFGLCNPNRMSIDRMRNFAAAAAMECDFDWLVFIDDDVLVPFDCISKLLKHVDKGFDVISGVTLIRGYPFHPMLFDFSDKENHYVDDYEAKAENGLLTCDAVGFSLCMIRVALFKKMVPPFFITGTNFTEDVYFCQRAKQQVPGVKIGADVTIETAHILGPEFISPANKKERLIYEESQMPELAKKKERDRGLDYFQRLGVPLET